MNPEDPLNPNPQPPNPQPPNDNILQLLLNLTKTPDPIKNIPPFDGTGKNLYSWIDQVTTALGIFDMVRANPLYLTWVKTIRSKILGKAHEALVTSCVDQNANWQKIRETLIEHFGDKRDIATLVQGIPYMRQKNLTVDEFYADVSTACADVSQKLSLHPKFGPNAEVIMDFMNSIIANAFIDGLNEPISGLVRSSRPDSLVDAYRVAKEHDLARNRKSLKNDLFRESSGTRPKYPNTFQNKPQRYANNFQKPFNASNNQNNFQNNFQKTPNFQNTPNTSQRTFNGQNQPNYYSKPQNAQQPSTSVPPVARDSNKSSNTRISTPMSGISYRSLNRANNLEEVEENDEIQEAVEEEIFT